MIYHIQRCYQETIHKAYCQHTARGLYAAFIPSAGMLLWAGREVMLTDLLPYYGVPIQRGYGSIYLGTMILPN